MCIVIVWYPVCDIINFEILPSSPSQKFRTKIEISSERIQRVFTCSKLTIETLEQSVKYAQS